MCDQGPAGQQLLTSAVPECFLWYQDGQPTLLKEVQSKA